MILIVSTCSDKLSELEFVKPIEDILTKSNIDFSTKHYNNLFSSDLGKVEKIIICGTALKDFGYLKNLNYFSFLKCSEKPVLGICAGMQILVKLFDGILIGKTMIGRHKVKIYQKNKLTNKKEFDSYFLNSKAVKIIRSFKVLARSKGLICMVKHDTKEIYGCLFHPEALNEDIIINFCNIVS